MCNLRGLLMLKLNRGDQAKACFMEALALDVKCYDAFEQLVGGEMMALEEGALSPLFDYAPRHRLPFRVGICTVPCVQGPNSRRCRVRASSLHVTAPKIQARGRTRAFAETTCKRVWLVRQS
jgi:hypothetical protein